MPRGTPSRKRAPAADERSGWNCAPHKWPWRTRRRDGAAIGHARRGRGAVVAGEAVREIDVVARRRARRPRSPRSASSPCAGPAAAGRGRARGRGPGSRPSSAVSPSSDASNIICMPRQMPSVGLVRRASGSTSPALAQPVHRKARRADAGQDQAVGVAARRRVAQSARPRPRAARRRGGSNRYCRSQGRGSRARSQHALGRGQARRRAPRSPAPGGARGRTP